MKQPIGFVDQLYPDDVCKFSKSLYSLKQALRSWCHESSSWLVKDGFKNSIIDTILFIKHSDSNVFLLLVYVDDILLNDNNYQFISADYILFSS